MVQDKKTRFLVTSALLSAVGFLLMLVEFPLPLLPPFLRFNIGDLPCMLAAFAGGPLMAAVVVVLKNVIYTAIRFSSEQLVGGVANILIGLAYVLPAAFVYRKHKDRKHAIRGMTLGTAAMIIAGLVTNYYINIPFYAWIMGVDVNTILAMAGSPAFGTMWGYLLLAVLPFNLIRGVVMSAVTLLVYKPLSPILHR
jgi:riboflavin transporter FmnP